MIETVNNMRIYLDNEHKNILGKNIRKIRKERKLTQKDLAAKVQTIGLDMDRLAIVRIEAGTRVIADYEVLYLKEALELKSIDELFKNCTDEKGYLLL